MSEIPFDNGAAYERYMGVWSQLVGDLFIDWLAPQTGLRWLDVGCGTGAFTEKVFERCVPASVHGIDLSEKQLAYARARLSTQGAVYEHGDAMALPFPDHAFDVAVMPLVIFFVPDPARGVAEMVRVVKPGGLIAAYAWDVPGGGLPYDALHAEMRGMGTAIPEPPSPDTSRTEALRELWSRAGLTAIRTTAITVQRTFIDFDDYWATVLGGPSVGLQIAALPADDLAFLQARMRARLVANEEGRITYSARTNAILGRVAQVTEERQAP